MAAVMGLALRACQAVQVVEAHHLLPLVGLEHRVKVRMAAQRLVLMVLLVAVV